MMKLFFKEGNGDQLEIEVLRLEFGWLWHACHNSFIASNVAEANVIWLASFR